MKIEHDVAEDFLEFLYRIDEGYTPTREEERNLLSITELDLSGFALDELPECLGQLSALQSLDLSDNVFEELPDCLGQLSALNSLDLSDNLFQELPSCLGQLSMLQNLDINNNQLYDLPDFLGQLSELQFLDISYNRLTYLSNQLGQLSALQSLDVNSNWLIELPDCFGQLFELQSLDLSSNELAKLPDCFGQLSALQTLDLSENLLTELPDCFGQLSKLQTLSLNDNQLTELPDSLGQLSALQNLNASRNHLMKLPDCLAQLTTLRTLNLSRNQLSKLPDCWAQLSALKELSLSYNALESLPKSIGNLRSLYKLGLGGNQLTELPDTFSKLSSLQMLYIWHNRITSIPEQIFACKGLQFLDIGHSPIQSIPPQITKLKKLHWLNLSSLNLHQLPAELMSLKLPFVFSTNQWSQTGGILLKGVTLATQPLSLFMQPSELIQAYFDAEQTPVNEGKVIFLGHGDVGKSYSIQRILHHDERGDFKTSMTPGISISHFPVEQDGRQFDICFWDFGGQEIMHAMHRCFLTHRTCYVVMVSNRQPDLDGQARYWLRNVESFAAGSDVLLVINRWEDYPSNQDLNYNQLRTDFKNLVGCVSVSAKCDDKQSFHRLTKQIIQMAAKLDSTGMNFPIQWYTIRQSLIDMAKNDTYYINQDDYYQICTENELTDANIRMWLLEWFNDLGTCFSYHQDTDKKELKAYKVLNPEWLTNAIYIVILNGKKFTKNGVIFRKGIEYLLSNPTGGTLSDVSYTPEECGYILEVMRKFTLSYSASETEEFIPALCPNETPKNLYPTQYANHLAYELEYSYLPDSVVHQLMIYCYQYLTLDKCWRRGMSINIAGMGLSAVVSMGGSDQLLSINVYSNDYTPLWMLLQPLLDAIQRINAKLNLHAVDYVFAETDVDGEVFQDRYTLDHILSVKKGSAKRKPSDNLQGKEVDHSISELLTKLYGENNLHAAETETQQRGEAELTQSLLAGATLTNCTLIFGDHNKIHMEQHQAISNEILQAILDHQEQTTEAFLSELAQLFAGQGSKDVQELGQAMQSAQEKGQSSFEVLRERLDDADKLASITANLYTAWPAIQAAVQKLPALAAWLGDLLDKACKLLPFT